MKLINVSTGLLICILAIAAKAEKFSGLDNKLWQQKNKSVKNLTWEPASPGNGGTCWYLAIHPTDSDTVIESCDMGGCYISFNGSKKYNSMNNYDSTFHSPMHNINSVSFCLAKPEIGYAGCELRGVFKTYDKGKTWTALNTPGLDKLYKGASFFNTLPKKKAMISSVAVSPDNPDIVWIGLGRALRLTKRYEKVRTIRIQRGLASSKDGGKTWTYYNKILPVDAMARKIIIAPRKWGIGDAIFICSDKGIYASFDAGVTFKKLQGLPHDNVLDMDIVFDKKLKKVVMVSSLLSIAVDKGNHVDFKGGVWQSFDLGKSWKDVTGNLRLPMKLVVKDCGTFADPVRVVMGGLRLEQFLSMDKYKKLYAKTSLGLRDNKEIKKAWNDFQNKEGKDKYSYGKVKQLLANSPTILPDFFNVRLDPRNSNIIYASIATDFIPYGIWKTQNGGKNWYNITRAAQGWKNKRWQKYCPPGEPVFNVGQVWTEKLMMNYGTVEVPFALWEIRTFDISKSNPDILSFHSHRVSYRSEDAGKTWHDVSNHYVNKKTKTFTGNGNSNLCIYGLNFSPKDGSKMLIWTADCGLFTSRDGGKSLSSVKDSTFGSNQYVLAAAFDPSDSNRFYAMFTCRDWMAKDNYRGHYFLQSNDLGKTCENFKISDEGKLLKRPSKLPFSGQVNTLLIDPRSPVNKRRMIIAHSPINRYSIPTGQHLFDKPAASKGIMISDDGGKSWRQSNRGLNPENLNIMQIVPDPEDFKTLYAAVYIRCKNNKGRLKVFPGGLYVSKNSGESWSKVETLPLKAVANVAIAGDGVMYVSGGYKKHVDGNGGVYRSYDKGKTWTQILKCPAVSALAVNPFDSKNVYCAIEGLRRANVKSLGVWRTFDAGETWEKVNRGLNTNFCFTSLVFNPHKRNEIWVTTYSSGFYSAKQ